MGWVMGDGWWAVMAGRECIGDSGGSGNSDSI